MIYVCVVTMTPKNQAYVESLLPGIRAAGGHLRLLLNGGAYQDWLPLRRACDQLNGMGGQFKSYHSDTRLGCAEARMYLVEAVWPVDDDILLFMDDDISAHGPDWVKQLTAPILAGDADIVGAEGRRVVLTPSDGFLTRTAASGEAVDYVSGGWCAISSRVFRRIGGFDTNYHPNYWEDVDFCLRARLRGFRMRMIDNAGLIHHGEGRGNFEQAEFTHEVFSQKWTMRQIEILRKW